MSDTPPDGWKQDQVMWCTWVNGEPEQSGAPTAEVAVRNRYAKHIANPRSDWVGGQITVYVRSIADELEKARSFTCITQITEDGTCRAG